jgi:hypothetical protein
MLSSNQHVEEFGNSWNTNSISKFNSNRNKEEIKQSQESEISDTDNKHSEIHLDNESDDIDDNINHNFTNKFLSHSYNSVNNKDEFLKNNLFTKRSNSSKEVNNIINHSTLLALF